MRKLLTTALASVGLAAVTSIAPAAADTTWPAPFTYCPVGVVTDPASGATTTTCITSVGFGGTFKLGKTVVTLKPGTNLQGGLGLRDGGLAFIPANDGMTLTGPDQDVPGGILGIAKIQNLIPGVTNIGAAVELVGTPDFSLGANIDITLPVQVHLKNHLLGPHCTIGSAAHPIVLHLTTGTTAPPAGTAPMTGAIGAIEEPALGAPAIEFKGQTVVDNTFAVPGATGCGGNLLNKVVNQKAGVPAAAGVSTATLVNNSFIVAASDVANVTGYYPGM